MADYIDREALLEDLLWLAKYQTGDKQQGILDCISTTRHRLAANVAPIQHAKWIRKGDTDEYKCSKCTFDHVFFDSTPEGYNFYYCPYCGAEMDFEEGEEDG